MPWRGANVQPGKKVRILLFLKKKEAILWPFENPAYRLRRAEALPLHSTRGEPPLDRLYDA
jgi:hypothetical protein